MRLVIISDPHGIFAALQAVIRDLYLRGLSTSHRCPLPERRVLALVHATPWSIVEVVRPDAPEGIARRMLSEGQADVLAYGHIHCAYQRGSPPNPGS